MSDTPATSCSLDATTLARRRSEIHRAVFGHVRRVEELPLGYVLHFDRADDLADSLEELCALEGECCPFIESEIEQDADADGLRLVLSSLPEGKALLYAELSAALPQKSLATRRPATKLVSSAAFLMTSSAILGALCCMLPMLGVGVGLGASALALGSYLDPLIGLTFGVGCALLMVAVVRRRRASKQLVGSCGCS